MILKLLLFVIFTITSFNCFSNEELTKSINNDLINHLDNEQDLLPNIELRMKYHGVPGVSITVIDDYKIAWSKSYGVRNLDDMSPVSNNTLFQVASISKPVTAVATLKLIEEGKLKLDTEVNSYLTSWKIKDNKLTEQSPVLIKHLLNHTSGLTVSGFAGYKISESLPTLTQILDGKSSANSATVEVNELPGSSYRYSGGAYTVLQQLLIDNEGKEFEQLMFQKVLKPLKMNNSTFKQPLPNEFRHNVATGYPQQNKPIEGGYHIYPEQAAAGLWTTSHDLAKFVMDLQSSLKDGGGVMLSKHFAKKMTSPSISNDVGLGLFLWGDGYFSHDGWNEGFSSSMLAHKSRGYGIIVLTNTNKPSFNYEITSTIASKYHWVGF